MEVPRTPCEMVLKRAQSLLPCAIWRCWRLGPPGPPTPPAPWEISQRGRKASLPDERAAGEGKGFRMAAEGLGDSASARRLKGAPDRTHFKKKSHPTPPRQ